MRIRIAEIEEFEAVRDFYWETIDLMEGRTDTVGWKKGIYPSDQFLKESIENGELYVIKEEGGYIAGVVINSKWNEGYEGLPWSIDCAREEIMVPHALAVHPALHGQRIGTAVVEDILSIARERGIKTVRLDILGGNTAAEQLYLDMGFQFVQAKDMFYEDTGWTEFLMYELVL